MVSLQGHQKMLKNSGSVNKNGRKGVDSENREEKNENELENRGDSSASSGDSKDYKKGWQTPNVDKNAERKGNVDKETGVKVSKNMCLECSINNKNLSGVKSARKLLEICKKDFP